mmetsp:Transcript_8719/g.24042  ORF Transcript_8719/g.24042 Transcript_8719/m.24042 type:complete len:276 (+) Transcript_8719:641-1468(+)
MSSLINLPILNPDELAKISETFRQKYGMARGDIFKGCVGCMDGWLARMHKPKYHPNPNSFYAYRYKEYGLAVQAVVDALARFVYVWADAPGSCHDSACFSACPLAFALGLGLMDPKYFIIADSAYRDEEWMLTPFTHPRKGAQPEDEKLFNAILSGHRQVSERAFALLVKKWLVFQRPLQMEPDKVGRIVVAAMILHNFCIDTRQSDATYSPVANFTRTQVRHNAHEVTADGVVYTNEPMPPHESGYRSRTNDGKLRKNLYRFRVRQRLNAGLAV